MANDWPKNKTETRRDLEFTLLDGEQGFEFREP